MNPDVERILFTEEEINLRIEQLSQQISDDYKNVVDEKNPLVIIGTLRGAVIFFADIVRKIDLPMEFDFVSMSSYRNSTISSGEVEIRKDIDLKLESRHILIIEDIIDSGRSMQVLKNRLAKEKPASMKICALLDKPSRRVTDVTVDYCGFEVPDEFIVGYGLDYAQRYRNLPYVGILKREIYS